MEGRCTAMQKRGWISGKCQIRRRRCPPLTTKLHLISHSFSTKITFENILWLKTHCPESPFQNKLASLEATLVQNSAVSLKMTDMGTGKGVAELPAKLQNSAGGILDWFTSWHFNCNCQNSAKFWTTIQCSLGPNLLMRLRQRFHDLILY